MNFVTECLTNVATIEAAMAPAVAKKQTQMELLRGVLIERLQLWCEQFYDSEVPMPHFNGQRGIGFVGSFKDNICSDEKLVEVKVVGDVALASFSPGLFPDYAFTMKVPMRYLEAAGGLMALLKDASDVKAEYHAQNAETAPSLG